MTNVQQAAAIHNLHLGKGAYPFSSDRGGGVVVQILVRYQGADQTLFICH